MKNKLTIQFSPTKLKQMKKIVFSENRAKFKILNGKLEEGFYLLKSTAKKFKSFATDLADRIPQILATRISLDLFSHFESKSSKQLGIPKGFFLGGVLALMASLPTVGQTINVTSTADAGPNTLRQAILDANANATAGTIRLAQGRTYTIASNLPAIDDKATGGTLQIICTGTTPAIIDGAGANRPLTMSVGSDLTISNITVQNGFVIGDGGAIHNNRGDLTISNSSITTSQATSNGGAIFSTGSGGSASVLIHNSSISMNSTGFNGGGIFNQSNSPLTISSSSILGNTARFAGGILNQFNSPLTISSSSISGNTATDTDGGGIKNYNSNITIQASSITANQSGARGGAMMIQGAMGGGQSVLLQNTTISGNTSTGNDGGGIYHLNYGGVNNITLQHVTMSDNTGVNTGAFENNGTSNIIFQNTIIANSTGVDFALSGTAPTSHISTGTIVADGSLVDAGNVLNVDPLLGALTLNSGFLIHPLLMTSPAINAGDDLSATIPNDQIGNTRGTSPHIGAVEVTVPNVCMVVTAPAGVTNTWIGCTSDDWGTASNWSSGSVPTESDVVYVPTVAANQLVIDEVATCAKLEVQIGAKCLVNYNAGGKLVIKF